MPTDSRTGTLGDSRSPGRPTFLELFVDLVFVFALTRLSQRLTDDFTLERRTLLSELGQTTLVLLALWMIWSLNALMTSRFDPRRDELQLLIVAGMFGSMLMAVSLPQAFGDLGTIFASTYVTIHVGRPLFLVLRLRGHRRQSTTLRILCWAALAAVPWIAGALTGGLGRGVLWTVAVIVDYTGTTLRWRVPWLGRVSNTEWAVGGEHLAERYQQMLLIALGDSILITGFIFSRAGFAAERTATFVASFAATVLLWRIYFARPGHLLGEALNRARDAARVSQAVSHAHLLMVAGIIATAVGYGLVIAHPSAPTDPAWVGVILGGPAVFMAGRGGLEYEIFGWISRAHWGGLLALVALIPPMVFAPLPAVVGGGTLVLAGIAAADAFEARHRPAPEVAAHR